MGRHAMGRACGAGDIFATAKTGVDQVPLAQQLEGVRVTPHVVGLAMDRPVPRNAEPSQIYQDRRLEFLAAARLIDILDPQPEQAALGARRAKGEQRRIGMA